MTKKVTCEENDCFISMISLEYYTLIIYLLLLAIACYTTTQEIGLKKNT